MVYINGVLINSNLWRCLMMCITLINGLVLINAYIGINHRLQNLLMNNTFLKELEYVCHQKEIKFDHKKNNIRCLDHVINLTVKEILKNIKAGDAQEEDELLELVSQEEQEDDVNVEIIPKLRLLLVKISSSTQQKEKFTC